VSLVIDRAPDAETLHIGVLGLGYWGPNHVRNLQELTFVRQITACDLAVDRLERVARRFPAVHATTDYEAVLADDSIDAVVIATPVVSHYQLAAAALAAGKHVLVEKPLTASSLDAVGLIKQAKAADRVLMPGHTFIYSPPVEKIKSLIDSGDLGEIYFVSTSRVNLGLHQPDASVAWDLGPHDFSILRHLLDQTPSHVSAMARCCIMPGVPDVAFINLEYTSGTVAHVELSWLAPSKLRRTTIVGSRRMIVYDDTANEPVRVFDSGASLRDPQTFGEYGMTYRTGDIVSPQIEAAEPIQRELIDFCEAILTGRTPRSSAELGLEVVRTIEAVDTSLASGGARVPLDASLVDA
jgi:predicted dehydrogenase